MENPGKVQLTLIEVQTGSYLGEDDIIQYEPLMPQARCKRMTSPRPQKIVVVGIGYVGLSNAVLLAQNNEVTAIDHSTKRIEKISAKKVPDYRS